MKCLGKVFLVFWVILFITDLQAQHCPYDGLYTIAINTGKAFKKGQPTAFYLVEKPSGRKDSCRFNPMVDTVRFFSEAELRNKLAADPNSTQKDCMVPRGNEYDLLPRNFVVVYTFNGSATEVPVPAERIYSLCGTGGSWKRIKPIEIQLP
jgi:hypothetical protein